MEVEQSRFTRHHTNDTIGIIGVSVKEGQTKTGVEKAPQLFRECGLTDLIPSLGYQIADYGDITREDLEPEIAQINDSSKEYKYKVMNGDVLGAANKSLSQKCFEAAARKETVLVLGGDHGLATGSIHGIKKAHPNLKVLWFDAHGDCNTPETSPSGNYHGMPVAHLLGWMKTGEVEGFDWMEPCLKPEDIVFVGLRDIDLRERELLRKHNIKVYTPFDIEDMGGIANVMDEALELLGASGPGGNPLHISFDVDGCDPSFLKATGTRARCGVSERETHYILRKVARSGNLVSMDMVEINPELEPDQKATREVLHGDLLKLSGPPSAVYACEFVLSALGNVWL